MNKTPWNKRFLATTRGRIVALLRRASRTVNELAEALDLTDNAVRAQIATLERDGIVEQSGARRGAARKPNTEYDLTPEAVESLFPKAYAPVLEQLLAVLDDRLPGDERDRLMREVGHRLASDQLPGLEGRPREERIAFAMGLLSDLGAVVEMRESDVPGALLIAGRSCPLAAVVASGRPEACQVAQTLIADLIGEPVTERCDRDANPPRCCFEIRNRNL